jgi:hypothetical protein
MAARAYHNNVEILDMHRGADTSQVRFPPEGCCVGAKPDPGLMTALRFYAKKEIKEQWRAAGIRVQYCLPREIHQAAEQYLSEHWQELLPQAEALLAYINKSAQRKQRSKHKRITVQMSGAE